jgi:hypothetical protein
MDITRDTYEKMDVDTKLNVLFDFAFCACEDAKLAAKAAEGLKESFRKKVKVDAGTAGVMGFIGGLVGFFSQKIFFKGPF